MIIDVHNVIMGALHVHIAGKVTCKVEVCGGDMYCQLASVTIAET